jgi:two-component system cell cycle sensor histidine kinase PleC
MTGTDAWGAPDRSSFAWQKAGRRNGIAGNARIIAAPAYRRLLAAEPLLKRSIPTLIVLFLIVVALVRFLSLMAWHDDIERDARATLMLGAGELSKALLLEKQAGNVEPQTERLIDEAAEHAAFGHVLVITGAGFEVVAANAAGWEGRDLDAVVAGGQPLFMFGVRAGAMEVRIGGE